MSDAASEAGAGEHHCEWERQYEAVWRELTGLREQLAGQGRAPSAGAEWDVIRLRQFLADVTEEMECLPGCDSYAHEEDCPVIHPVEAWRRLRAELAALRASGPRPAAQLETVFRIIDTEVRESRDMNCHEGDMVADVLEDVATKIRAALLRASGPRPEAPTPASGRCDVLVAARGKMTRCALVEGHDGQHALADDEPDIRRAGREGRT